MLSAGMRGAGPSNPRKKQDKGGGPKSRMSPDQAKSLNRSNCTTMGSSPHTSNENNSSIPLCNVSIHRPGVSYHDCIIVNELIRTSPVKDKYERLEAFQTDDHKTQHVDYMFYVMEVRRLQINVLMYLNIMTEC